MTNDADIIKEFLVSLGFVIDKSSADAFTSTVGETTLQVLSLGAATAAVATAVVAGVAEISEGLESLYFASRRTNASVENIQAAEFAARNLGAAAGAAAASIESVASLLRNSPGGEGFLKNIGIQTRDVNGSLRDTGELVTDLGTRFAAMPFYKSRAYAQALGIDDKTLLAMREGMGEFSATYKEMLRATGLDSQQAAKDAHGFMVELRTLGSLASMLAQKVGGTLAARMSKGMNDFRTTALANFEKISKGLDKILDVVIRIGGAFGTIALRGFQAIGYLIDKFNSLSEGSQTIIKWLGAILVAWRLLNTGFMLSPIGRIFALAAALALLWDDYQVWKEGGKSLIDWASWGPPIEKALETLASLGAAIHAVLEPLGDWRPAFELVLGYVAGSWLLGMLGAIGKATAAMVGLGTASTAAGLAASAAQVAAAGGVGYVAGSLLYKHVFEGTAAGDKLGGAIANVMANFGNKEAQQAVQQRQAVVNAPQAPGVANPPQIARPGQTPAPVVNVGAPVIPGQPASAPARPGQPAPPVVNVGAPVIPGQPVPVVRVPPAPEPRGIRNNNPGNIEYGPFARSQGSERPEFGADQRFATFPNAQQGLNALATLLRQYAARGTDTVKTIIEKYSPVADKGNAPGSTQAYIVKVAQQLGVTPETKLNLNDAGTMSKMIDAVVRFENAKNPYRAEQIAQAAAVPASAQRGPVEVKQTTSITLNGNTSPQEVQSIMRAQDSINDRLVRNMKGAVVQ